MLVFLEDGNADYGAVVDMLRFVEKHRLIILIAVLSGVLLGAMIEIFAVYGAGIADWYMHLLMWLLLLAYYCLAAWTIATGKVVRTWVNMIILECLSVFWIVILISKIPSEKVVIMNQLTLRQPLYIAWFSVFLLAFSALLLPLGALGRIKASRTPAAPVEAGNA